MAPHSPGLADSQPRLLSGVQTLPLRPAGTSLAVSKNWSLLATWLSSEADSPTSGGNARGSKASLSGLGGRGCLLSSWPLLGPLPTKLIPKLNMCNLGHCLKNTVVF